MSKDSTKVASNILLGAEWQDSIEGCVRTQIRGVIEGMLEVELSHALGRARYERAGSPKQLAVIGNESDAKVVGHRNGHRDCQLIGELGATTVAVSCGR